MDQNESTGWYEEIIRSLGQDTIAYEAFTDQTATEFDGQQQFFNNIAYQRYDPEDARWLDIPRRQNHYEEACDVHFNLPSSNLLLSIASSSDT